MGYSVGIDLGTVSLKAALAGGGRTWSVPLSPWSTDAPALTHVGGVDETAWVSGPAARTAGLADGLVREAKRAVPAGKPIMVGEVPVEPTRVLGHQLHWVYRACVAQADGPVDHVVVTHPSSWDDPAVQRLTASVAGHFPDMPMLLESEVIAAATAWAARGSENEAGSPRDGSWMVVVDAGGGTMDVSVVALAEGRFTPVGIPIADPGLAGVQLIDAVRTELARTRPDVAELAPADGLKLAQWALEATSQASERQFALPVTEADQPLVVRRTEIENVALPLADEVVRHVRRAVSESGLDPADLLGALLAGGVARAPLLGLRLREQLDIRPLLAGDPAHCVARGAAVIGAERGVATDDWAPPPAPRPDDPDDPDSPDDPPELSGPDPDRPSGTDDRLVSTVSRFRRPSNETFTTIPNGDVEADESGVVELPPDRRLVILAVVVAAVVALLLLAGRLIFGG